METLSGLLEETSKAHEVRKKLLEQLLQVERIHIYLSDTSRQSVLNRIREIVKEEAKLPRS